jgi:hypothetical protein
MQQNTWLKPTMCLVVALLLVLVVVVAATPTATLAGEAKVQRLIFVSAGFNEGNRFWTIGRPFHLQFDPFLENPP